ncbi:UNKNOWN [Stylonychia lemnae]|uniref:Uncharacterized protein n=1 Tax=Stylonychia lemnae TaxID=5949 RepID=A0A078A2K8_STYLE|nr:UNKNOWN [Stylonychia lemnae]|eukprot:CDW76325.1 UNKNOWN [Stylonychia lemnae]
MKKEIERIRDQNTLLTQKLNGSKPSQQQSSYHIEASNKNNLEQDTYHSRNSPGDNQSFKLSLKKASQSINKTMDYSTQPSSGVGLGLPNINNRTLNRDKSIASYSNRSQLSHLMEGNTVSIKNSNQVANSNILPSLYGVEDFNVQIVKLQHEINQWRTQNTDLEKKLKDSEHKRHEHLRKNLELQKKILDLENQIKQLQQRFKDLMLKKASGILREQFQELEIQHAATLKDLKIFKDKDEKFLQRIEAVKMALKQQNDKYREAMEQERQSMIKQIDNFKLFVAELRTEVKLFVLFYQTQEQKTIIQELRMQVSSLNQQQQYALFVLMCYQFLVT